MSKLVHLGLFAGVGAHLTALVPRLGTIGVTYDFAALAAEQTVRGRFVRDVQASTGLDEDARRRVLITGLRALEVAAHDRAGGSLVSAVESVTAHAFGPLTNETLELAPV